MDKIKVCHICNLGMNGKAVFVCNLLENTDFENYEVTIINFRAEHADPVIKRLEKLPIRIVNPHEGGLKNFCTFLNVHFKENHYDVCHSHIWDLSGLFLAIAKHNHIKIRVVHSHNTSKADGRYNKLKVFVRDKILWNYLRYLIKTSANRWVACSEEAAEWLFPKSIIQDKKYMVVSNGIDLKRFKSPDRTRHNPTEILFAGRLIYQKNPLFAINTFHEYLKLDPTAHMTMVGKGMMEAEVEAEIKRLGLVNQITCVYETSEMEKYYKNADVYLFPSNYEGLGITLIEAQASGLKCLASDVVPRESQCGLVKYKPLQDGYFSWGGYSQNCLMTV
jgi:glycosyltransferase involved in cell wall biosynthesis